MQFTRAVDDLARATSALRAAAAAIGEIDQATMTPQRWRDLLGELDGATHALARVCEGTTAEFGRWVHNRPPVLFYGLPADGRTIQGHLELCAKALHTTSFIPTTAIPEIRAILSGMIFVHVMSDDDRRDLARLARLARESVPPSVVSEMWAVPYDGRENGR